MLVDTIFSFETFMLVERYASRYTAIQGIALIYAQSCYANAFCSKLLHIGLFSVKFQGFKFNALEVI